MTHTERGQIALTKLAERDLAFSLWTLWCKHVDSDQPVAPAWTDGKTVFYGKEYESFSFEEKIAVAAHELMHVALRHPARGAHLRSRLGNDYDHKVFNIAIDGIVNETLRAAGYKLPGNCFFLTDILTRFLGEPKTAPDECLSKWDSESLYMSLIKTKVSDVSKKGKGTHSQSSSKSSSDYDPTVAEALKEWAREAGFDGDLEEVSIDPATDAQEAADWAQRIQQGLNSGRLAGQGIGTLGYQLKDIPKSKTPWEMILRSSVVKATTRQPIPSWVKPTRRFLAMDSHAIQSHIARPVYEQGWNMIKGVPRIVVGVDVSGSISNSVLNRFAGEIASIGDKTGAEIHVLVFDTQVLSRTQLKGHDFKKEVLSIQFARGGGTDFVPMIREAVEIDPSIIVVLTDLYADFGPDPRVKVVWAVEEENGIVPPYGQVIVMND